MNLMNDWTAREISIDLDFLGKGTFIAEIWEDAPHGYTPEYDCQVGATCSSNAGTGPCSFEGIGIDQEEVCLIRNNVSPVDVTVAKEWLLAREDLVVDDSAVIELYQNQLKYFKEDQKRSTDLLTVGDKERDSSLDPAE